jgi:two-component system response regulator HydG
MLNKGIKILVADDEETVRYMVSTILEQEGYEIDLANDGVQAINSAQKKAYDVVLCDIKMPKVDGIEVLRFVKDNFQETEIIMLTAVDDIKVAVDCMKLGAYDFLRKPSTAEELKKTIAHAVEHKRLIRDNVARQAEISRLVGSSEIIGTSTGMLKVLDLAARVAPTESTILIQGSSGTGKELIANFIFKNSSRKDFPFVTINCASIPDSLIESELFGHEKGAFTDARSVKQGLVQIADGGTLFLDEVGDVSQSIQPKILRFIQNGEFRRVGGNTVYKSDVRIISATNKDLVAEVKAGRFREDLLYRLNVITLEIPPLRDRKEDIPLLVDWFIKHKLKTKVEKKVSPKVFDVLMNYDWPGNVRELENVIERAAILSENDMIQPHDISLPLKAAMLSSVLGTDSSIGNLISIREIERQHIKAILKNLKGNKAEAAKILEISLKTLYTKIQQYQIEID